MVVPPPDEANAEETFTVDLDFAVSEGNDFGVVIKPRPGTRVVRLSTPTTRRQQDLVGAMFDMKRVAQLCKEYVAAIDSKASDIVQDALWMTAIILYGRCFNGGVRHSLDTAVLDSIPGQAREAHEHFIDLRNKFVAHSVNSYEQTLPYAVINLDTSEVISRGTTHLWANPMNKQGAETLERLAWAFHNAGIEQRSLLEIIVGVELSQLDSAAIGRLPDLAVETPDVAKGQRPRKR